MGTRHLTMIIQNGKPALAQYGQWDGYPEGQGATVLKFLTAGLLDAQFLANLARCYEPTDQQIEALWGEAGGLKNGMASMAVSEKFEKLYPTLHRNIGAGVLQLIHDAAPNQNLPLRMREDFAADSLFCEWAYVIDLDKRQFEVFKGFNKESLAQGDRFFHLQKEGEEYKPVRRITAFPLDKLPSQGAFLDFFKEEEEA
jgi:hypothetical protein